MSYRPPYDWQGLLGFLAARAIPGVEAVVDGAYVRTIRVATGGAVLRVVPDPRRNRLLLELDLTAPGELAGIVARARRLFDVGACPDIVAARLSTDDALAASLAARPGVRIPGAWDGFEVAVRAILGQQITVAAASRLAGRLAERFGRKSGPYRESGLDRLFPTAAELSAVGSRIAEIGIPKARANAVAELATRVADGRLDLTGTADVDETRDALLRIPGVGPWTAEYVALRCLADPDAFLASDLGVRKALAKQGVVPTADAVTLLAEKWKPWRGYATMLLWLGPPPRPNERGTIL